MLDCSNKTDRAMCGCYLQRPLAQHLASGDVLINAAINIESKGKWGRTRYVTFEYVFHFRSAIHHGILNTLGFDHSGSSTASEVRAFYMQHISQP